MRRTGLIGVAAVVFAGALISASPAAATIRVDHNPDYRLNWSEFEVEAPSCPPDPILEDDGICEGVITVAWRGRVVYRSDDLFFASRSDVSGTIGGYGWSCRRPGSHTWTVKVYNDEGYTETRSGQFKVGRCGRWKPDPVSKGKAASTAARGWGNELVSSVRCARRAGHRGRWTCRVTHNNSYRECTNAVFLRFRYRMWFGDLEEDTIRKPGGRRCTYF